MTVDFFLHHKIFERGVFRLCTVTRRSPLCLLGIDQQFRRRRLGCFDVSAARVLHPLQRFWMSAKVGQPAHDAMSKSWRSCSRRSACKATLMISDSDFRYSIEAADSH